jgi:hypothetical protein
VSDAKDYLLKYVIGICLGFGQDLTFLAEGALWVLLEVDIPLEGVRLLDGYGLKGLLNKSWLTHISAHWRIMCNVIFVIAAVVQS